jgi:hypothetical protein
MKINSNAKSIIMPFLIVFLGICALGKGSQAATINAASCSYEHVNAAIAAASAGDTVNVPVGTCSWSNQLNITKSVSLIGAGQGQTIINNTYVPSGGLGHGFSDTTQNLINIVPAIPADNPAIRISGFTFNFGSTSYGILYANWTTSKTCIGNTTTCDLTRVRLDHLTLTMAAPDNWLFYDGVWLLALWTTVI